MTAIARVHVDDFDPEVYTGEDALDTALAAAALFRTDFPEAVIGVSYNPEASKKRKDQIMTRLGLNA